MTLEELKELLSTYGVNDQERNARILVEGSLVTGAQIEFGEWDESLHAWTDMHRMSVILTTEHECDDTAYQVAGYCPVSALAIAPRRGS